MIFCSPMHSWCSDLDLRFRVASLAAIATCRSVAHSTLSWPLVELQVSNAETTEATYQGQIYFNC